MPNRHPFNRRSQRPDPSSPFQVGDRIRAVSAFGHHGYQPGRGYTVVRIDTSDNTLVGRDATGSEGGWIKWQDCQKANEIGWDWLKTVLPAEALDLLSAFDGLESLTLRDDLRNRLVLQIPGLHDKILETMAEEDVVIPPKDSSPEVDHHLMDFADLD